MMTSIINILFTTTYLECTRNGTSEYTYIYTAEGASCLITIILGTSLNLLVIITYLRRRNIHQFLPYLLIVNQWCVDIFNKLIYCAFDIALVYFLIYGGELNRFFTIFNNISTFASLVSSGFYFFLVGVDR